MLLKPPRSRAWTGVKLTALFRPQTESGVRRNVDASAVAAALTAYLIANAPRTHETAPLIFSCRNCCSNRSSCCIMPLQLFHVAAAEGPRNRNHVVRELLLTEQKELLQLEGLMQKDDLRKELDVLQQVIQGWERVEALDKQLEAKEKRVEELEAAIAASRNLLRCMSRLARRGIRQRQKEMHGGKEGQVGRCDAANFVSAAAVAAETAGQKATPLLGFPRVLRQPHPLNHLRRQRSL